jgi:phospholipid/cholesterol/gamma-HCH transport system ATP-binding protein
MDGGLVLRDVSFRVGRITVLDHQSVVVPRGGTLVVTGQNGVGKSTFLQLCAGLLTADDGEIFMAGHRIDGAPPSALVRLGIRRGFVFQQGGLVANLSALANVGLALQYHADVLDIDEGLIEERARFCLGALGVESPDIHSLPGRLSFGIRKRVAFARAMALEPNFAFFDDPDSGLDHENAHLVHEILLSYRDDPNVTMVVATNHRALIERMAVPMFELHAGRLHRYEIGSAPPSSLV